MSTRPTPTESMIRNVNMLKIAFGIDSNRHLSRMCGVSDRMIGKILNGDSNPTIEVADKIAQAFGITGWQIIMPNLTEELARNGNLDDLISNYSKSSIEGREYIDYAAKKEARYSNSE